DGSSPRSPRSGTARSRTGRPPEIRPTRGRRAGTPPEPRPRRPAGLGPSGAPACTPGGGLRVRPPRRLSGLPDGKPRGPRDSPWGRPLRLAYRAVGYALRARDQDSSTSARLFFTGSWRSPARSTSAHTDSVTRRDEG